MSKQISVGTGNTNPATIYSSMLDSGAGIAKGDIVALTGATGYTVIKSTNVMTPVGVAAETIAAGAWGEIITAGFCDYLTCTATNIVDGDLLYVDANSDAAGITVGTDLGVENGAVIGVALQAQEGTTITAAYISPAVQIVDSPEVPTGPGNLVPGTVYREMQATAAAIVKGDIVALSSTNGYTIIKATNVMTPIGVAAENFAASAWGKVIVKGFCNFLTCTAADIADLDLLHVDSASDAAGVTVGDDLGVENGAILGVTLQAQTGTTITASYISPAIQVVATPEVSTGPGNAVPGTETRHMQATAATIAKGDIVALSGETGYTVIKSTEAMMPCGVAAEDFAASGWGKVIVRGFCDYLTCTGADITDTHLLHCDASSDAAGVVVGADLGIQNGAVIGVTLQAQTGTTITKSYIGPTIRIV